MFCKSLLLWWRFSNLKMFKLEIFSEFFFKAISRIIFSSEWEACHFWWHLLKSSECFLRSYPIKSKDLVYQFQFEFLVPLKWLLRFTAIWVFKYKMFIWWTLSGYLAASNYKLHSKLQARSIHTGLTIASFNPLMSRKLVIPFDQKTMFLCIAGIVWKSGNFRTSNSDFRSRTLFQAGQRQLLFNMRY